MNGIYHKLFDENQESIIQQGKELGLSEEQEKVYCDPKFSWEQMYELQLGFVDGLSLSQVKSYANASILPEDMMEKRVLLGDSVGLSPSKDVLLENEDVKNLLKLLNETGNIREANEFLISLLQVDLVNTICRDQIKIISNLENQIKNMENETLRSRANEILTAAKRDLKAFANRLSDIKDQIVSGSKVLLKTFNISGKFAFYKGFEMFAKNLKNSFRALNHNNHVDIIRNKDRINKMDCIIREMDSIKYHRRNLSGLIVGEKATNILNSIRPRNISKDIILSLRNKFDKQNEMYYKVNTFLEAGAEKLESLENSFKRKALENKRDLNSVIAEAALTQCEVKKSHNKQKVHDREID